MLIAAPTQLAAANIVEATIHEVLSINKHIQSKKKQMPKDSWQNGLALILNKISMVFLKLLSIIDMRVRQVNNKINNATVVLVGLALVMVIEDFYQFFFCD